MTISVEDEETGGLLDEWMTRPALARELGVSVDTLARWESRRIGPPSFRVGVKVLYRREAVREWLREQEERKRGASHTRSYMSEWMTRPELARELGVSVDTLGRWARRGIGPPSTRVGRKVLYRRETVREWLREQEERKRGAFQRISGGRR